ncbi:hypothetical protein HOK51_06625 [Candidatus Woesearchaeota archaeon]|jgi:hypothetical protein|nr:hypothetical protein [Candidatus Woesearchaeota archaeon]MBT6519498.1 hypothetical protein [Candidatus Woesearchaeota archaeon]MBT7366937.1 hypothetical protein [Candidatus Woesearchaeota archaeon]
MNEKKKVVQNTAIIAGFFILLLIFLFGLNTNPTITGLTTLDKSYKTLVLTEDTVLNPGVYDYGFSKEKGIAILIKADNIVLDCRGSIIRGGGSGVGIYAVGQKNVKLKNCNIEGFEYGLYVDLDNIDLNAVNSYENTIEDICVEGICSVE